MANLCYTVYCAHGPNKTELLRFLLNAQEADGDLWAMYINAGYTEEELGADDNFFFRGEIQEVIPEFYKDDLEHNMLNLKCVTLILETKWVPGVGSIQKLASEKYEGVDVDVLGEEPGCEVYINTDETYEYIDAKYYTDFYDVGCDVWGHKDDKQLLKYIEDMTGLEFDSVKEAMDNIDNIRKAYAETFGPEEAEDAYCYIYQYETGY